MTTEQFTDLDGVRYRVDKDGWHPLTGPSGNSRRTDALPIPQDEHATVQPPPDLAREQDILSRFEVAVGRSVVGEQRLAKLVFLVITSRLLQRPVSLIVKGPSSGGKSHTVEETVEFFPLEAVHRLTGMSEKALVYSKESVSHRTLLLFEYVALKTGLKEDQTSYFIRSLLSEGILRYETVEKTKDGLGARLIEKPGPTNLIVTTTEVAIHPENETRALSVTVDDTKEQTRRVLRAIAAETEEIPNLEEWHQLQRWLAGAQNRVTIPYAAYLAENIPPVAIRLRRDFGAVLSLIRAHAVLHQLNRARDQADRIIASVEDYEVIRRLVEDLVSDAVGASVSETMRETVACVEGLQPTSLEGVRATAVGEHLDLDKSAAWRRLRAAAHRGYVRNLEERRGRPGRYVLGDPLPTKVAILPLLPNNSEGSEIAGQGHGCTVASATVGVDIV